MDLFGFNTSDIHVSNDKQKEKNMRVEMGRKQYFEDMQFQNQINKTDSQIKQQMLVESLTENLKFNNKSLNNKRALVESNKLANKLKTKVISRYLTEMTFHGLVFDDYFLKAHRKDIKANLGKTFDTLLEENLLNNKNYSNNILLEEAIQQLSGICDRVVETKDDTGINIFSESTILEILNEADKAKSISKEISDTVKDKVTDTLATEKKISKKKDDEKKKEEEEKKKDEEEAADSLDDDIPDEEDGDTDEDSSDSGEEEDSDEEPNEEDNEDDDSEGDEDDGEEDSEDSGDDDESEDDGEEDPEDESDEEDEYGDEDGSDEEEEEENPEDQGEEADGTEEDDQALDDSSSGLTLTVKTNGTSVSVTANKSESVEFLNLMGTRRFKNLKESKTLFRNILENCLTESVTILNESYNGFNNGQTTINMDMVLAESVIQYTLLETMYTSKLFDLKPSQIKKINNELLFRNR
jgi:hypothetical protein